MLYPQAARFLDQLKKLNLPRVEATTPEEARELMLTSVLGLGPPAEVDEVDDRDVPGPDGPITIRIYSPGDHAKGEAVRGAVLFFHGGGFVTGDLATHDGLCRALAVEAGTKVVAVDYRLAPEHKFPAAADDAFAATHWVRDHAAELDIDAGRISVAGDSAGGNLAAVVAMMTRDRGLPPLAFQVLIYPVTDFDFETESYRECREGYMLTTSAMRWFWDQYLAHPGDGETPYASPLRADDHTNLPPALVITAGYDPLHDDGEAYAAKLTNAGVPTELRNYDGMIHGFLRRLNDFDLAKDALTAIASAVRKALG